VIRAAQADPRMQILTAETSTNDAASSRVLEKTGFCRTGSRVDPEDGELVLWQMIVG
jgi:hypothetical protein